MACRVGLLSARARFCAGKHASTGLELGLRRGEGDPSIEGKSALEVACAHDKVDGVRALLRLGVFPRAAATDAPLESPAPWLLKTGQCRAFARRPLETLRARTLCARTMV